jgi:hypothetical protein
VNISEHCKEITLRIKAFPEADFWDEIQTTVLRVFLLSIHSHLYCKALPWEFYFFKLTPPLTVYTGQLLYTVKEKGGKPNKKNHTPSKWFKKFTQKLKV